MTNNTCGCCEDQAQLTPRDAANRPGLPALVYRVGTHATFLETMKARLSSLHIDLPRDEFDEHGKRIFDRRYPLSRLSTRASDDPAIALLDCWATVGAVLTFYQERIANEGYLKTAVERRSVLELARLVGYALRPGVSASVWLALELEKGYEIKLQPYEIKAQSVPGPREMPQIFENVEQIEIRHAWNTLQPRLSRPQTKDSIQASNCIYLKGSSTDLKPNDPLLIDFGDSKPQPFRVQSVLADTTLDRTLVTLADWSGSAQQADADYRDRVRVLAQRLQDVSQLKRSTARTEMVARVIGHLKDLETHSSSAISRADLTDFLREKTIPGISEELSVAESDKKYNLVKKWLSPLVKELSNEVETDGPSEGPLRSAVAAVPVEAIQNADPLVDILSKLTLPPSVPPRNTNFLKRALTTAFASRSDIGAQLVSTFRPTLRDGLTAALSNRPIGKPNPIRVYALRVKAAAFGQAAPKKILELEPKTGRIITVGEWPILEMTADTKKEDSLEQPTTLFLDGSHGKIKPGSWLMIEMSAVPEYKVENKEYVQITPADRHYVITRADEAQADISRAAYGIVGKVTRIKLTDPWLDISPLNTSPIFRAKAYDSSTQLIYDRDFQVLRNSTVYAQSEDLPLAEAPIELDLCYGATSWIELDGWYGDLKSGRWLIVSGERADITVTDPNDSTMTVKVAGVTASEQVMLAEVIQDIATKDGEPFSRLAVQGSAIPLPGEKAHTFIKLDKDLAYCYRRDTVTVYGNVVKATHGETRREALGSGDTGQAFQSFTLKQPPLTYVSSATPAGTESTLKVYVNDVQWHEKESLADAGSNDRKFVTKTDNDVKTTVIFGNGQHGLRLPTGTENIRAVYRNGIGKAGNARAEQISQLLSKPLGVKGVINPLRASGGAERDTLDQARENAPLAVMSLDRLVSIQDYADFVRTYAGIGKTAATALTYQHREIVHVTIAGASDIPIDPTSDLYRNLLTAIRRYGDPHQPFKVDLRELLLLVISAKIRILPDYIWDNVVAQVRTKLLETFSFERRELGQDVVLSEVIGTIQAVPGVAYVDVDVLADIPEKTTDDGKRRLLTPDEITKAITELLDGLKSRSVRPVIRRKQPWQRIVVGMADVDDSGTLRPARLAILSTDVPDTLILNQIE
jgi:hypothetical protein